MVRVRFAPSPTGFLHVGGLRTALYNWLLARRHGGTFILRVEDTDRTRLVEGAVENMVESLKWAGVDIDEGATVGGQHGPYVQSERLDIYQKHAEQLVEQGHAYYCFLTREELEAQREAQQKQDPNAPFRSPHRDLSPGEAKRRLEQGESFVVRLKVQPGETLVLDDIVRGEVRFATDIVDDQVLLKSDGFPTYHLAAVVDDHLMEITHVIRGEEWLSSTPKHLLLYRAFGWEPPRFAHLPLIVNQQKKKLSKRDGDVSVEAYREKGYLPEGLTNFLALLGWSAGDDKEFYTTEELIGAFALERVSKSASVFDFDKLTHINFLHMRTLPAERLIAETRPFFEKAGLTQPAPEYMAQVIELMRERAPLLTDLVDGCRYFYEDPGEFDVKALKKRWKDDSGELLLAYAERLEKLDEWTAASTEGALRELTEETGAGAGKLIHPTRLAVSGVGGGPGLFEMMEVLGQEVCLRRMRSAPALIEAQRQPQ